MTTVDQCWADIVQQIAKKYGFSPGSIKSAKIDKSFVDGARLVFYCSQGGTAFNYAYPLSAITDELLDTK